MATKKQTEAAPAEQAAPEVSAAEARNELGRALRVFRAFEHADKVLAVLENAEQVIAERQKMAAGALRMKDDAQAELDKALAAVQTAKDDAANIRANAKTQADGLVREARAQAVRITGEASERLRTLTDQVKEAEAARDEARAAIRAATAELGALQDKIAEAKKAARALLEG